MDKAKLLSDIREERARLERVLERIDGTAMVEPGAVGQWSAKDVLAHIAYWERTYRGWIEAASCGETVEMPAPGLTWEDVDLFNDRAYQASRDRSLADVRAEFAASYPLILGSIEATDEAVLLDPERNPLGARAPLWEFAAANTSDHYREHRESIETWLASRG